MTPSILNVNSVATMTSREIAELTGKEHKNVLADIRDMLAALSLGTADFSAVYLSENGQYYDCFKLPERECLILVSGYSIAMRAKIIDRWQELEAEKAAPSLDTEEGKLLMIQDMAAKQLALIHENKQIAVERDHAIKTKAQIGDKKTATAMATASHLKRENNKLKDELGFNTRHATVIAVEGASGKKFGKQDWRPLKAWCKANGASSVTVPCARYGKAQAWPSGAWGAVYGVDLMELFGEVMA